MAILPFEEVSFDTDAFLKAIGVGQALFDSMTAGQRGVARAQFARFCNFAADQYPMMDEDTLVLAFAEVEYRLVKEQEVEKQTWEAELALTANLRQYLLHVRGVHPSTEEVEATVQRIKLQGAQLVAGSVEMPAQQMPAQGPQSQVAPPQFLAGAVGMPAQEMPLQGPQSQAAPAHQQQEGYANAISFISEQGASAPAPAAVAQPSSYRFAASRGQLTTQNFQEGRAGAKRRRLCV